MNILERLAVVSGIQLQVLKEVHAEEAVQRAKRIKLLGLSEREETRIKKYCFPLPEISLQEDDEANVKTILEQIAQQRYARKPEQYKIWETDREIRNFEGTWSWLELRYPRHYAGYLDSISVSRDWQIGDKSEPTRVNVRFVRGKKEVFSNTRKAALDKEAQQIYEQIRAGLSR